MILTSSFLDLATMNFLTNLFTKITEVMWLDIDGKYSANVDNLDQF